MTNRTGLFMYAGLLHSAFAAHYNTLNCSASSAAFGGIDQAAELAPSLHELELLSWHSGTGFAVV